MTRDKVIQLISDTFETFKGDRCCSAQERKEVDDELAEVLLWIADAPREAVIDR